jgi:hypothetical protein
MIVCDFDDSMRVGGRSAHIGAAPGTGEPRRVDHQVLFRREGTYAAFPLAEVLADGRLAVAWLMNDRGVRDHYGVYEWRVNVSADEGRSWQPCDGVDPAVPFTWPGSSPRERYDRYAGATDGGALVAAGAVGWEALPAGRRAEAAGAGLRADPHPSGDPEQIMVTGRRLFTQCSADGGRSWRRLEWVLPPREGMHGFPRTTTLADGTILAPLYESDRGAGTRGRNALLRSTDGGRSWRYLLVGEGPPFGNESAFVETRPGQVLVLIRLAEPGFLIACWSDDAGASWSLPVQTEMWGYPPHLLKLRDGRVLCSVGVRRAPLGVQAFISEDGIRWDTAHPAMLRTDGETRDLGYPVSVQLADGSIFTVYYLTLGGVTHIAASRWELPW